MSTRYVEYTTGESNILTLVKEDLAIVPPEFLRVREQIGNTMHRNGLGYKQRNLDILATKNLLERGWNKRDLISISCRPHY